MYGDLPGTVPEGAEGEWPDLELPGPERPQPFPLNSVPGFLGEFIDATVQRGLQAHLAHAFGATAIGLLAAHDFDVQTLSGLTAPPMLSFAPLTSSGGRKSTVQRYAMRGHERADDRIAAKWEKAKQAAKGSLEGDEPKGPPARRARPTALQSNATVEASIMALAHGREVQAIETAEANAFYRGWSAGKARRSASLATLNDLLDGQPTTFQRRSDATDVRVSGRRLSFCGAAQTDAALEMLASREAADGFCARVMYSESSDRVPTTTTTIPPALGRMELACLYHRERQDKDQELAKYDDAGDETERYRKPARQVIELTPDVERKLRGLQDVFDEQADKASAVDDFWSSSFFSRGAENTIRLATIYDAADQYSQGESKGVPLVELREDYVDHAFNVILWYSTELRRLVERGQRTKLEQRFRKLQGLLGECRSEQELRDKLRVYRDGDGWAGNWSRLADRMGVRDPMETKLALDLVVQLQWMRPGGKSGRYLINPALIRVK